MQLNNNDVSLLTLKSALATKPNYRQIELLKDCPLNWQIVYSYTYTGTKDIDKNVLTYHTQEYHEIIIHLTSGRQFCAHTSLYEPKYGDIIIFPAQVHHRGINFHFEPYERYYIYINPALLPYMVDGDLISKCFNPDSPTLVRFHNDRRDAVLSEFAGLRDPSSFSRRYQFKLRNAIMQLFCELAVGENNYPPPANKLSPLLTGILEYIDKNYKTIHNSADIAEHFGISESYMSRLFREALQYSPYQYLQSVRLIEAKHLLRAGMSVTEACFESGFNDCSHFIAYFKRETGVTPTAYKNT